MKQDYWLKDYQYGDIPILMTTGGQGLEHPSRAELWKYIPVGSSVLDVGCCNGLMYEDAKQRGIDIKYHGVDKMPNVIDWNLEHRIGADFSVADASELPFEDNAFDITNSRHVIDHLPHYATHLIEMYRVARKRVIITTWRQLRTDNLERLRWGNLENGGSWDNQYNQEIMEDFIVRQFETEFKIINECQNTGNSMIIIEKKHADSSSQRA